MPDEAEVVEQVIPDAFTLCLLEDCDRCGEDHEQVPTERLNSPFDPDYADGRWTYWALCPDTHQPILLRTEADKEDPDA